MGIKVSYPVENGNTVPYPPRFDEIRSNYGFIDLRGRPELVECIPEIDASPALRSLLIDLTDVSSLFMTLGCDLGDHTERNRPLDRRRIAGGYVQFAQLPLGPLDKNGLLAFCRGIEAQLGADVGNLRWELKFAVCPTDFTFDGLLSTHTLWLWFFAAASTTTKARASREHLLSSLQIAIRSASLRQAG